MRTVLSCGLLLALASCSGSRADQTQDLVADIDAEAQRFCDISNECVPGSCAMPTSVAGNITLTDECANALTAEQFDTVKASLECFRGVARDINDCVSGNCAGAATCTANIQSRSQECAAGFQSLGTAPPACNMSTPTQ